MEFINNQDNSINSDSDSDSDTDYDNLSADERDEAKMEDQDFSSPKSPTNVSETTNELSSTSNSIDTTCSDDDISINSDDGAKVLDLFMGSDFGNVKDTSIEFDDAKIECNNPIILNTQPDSSYIATAPTEDITSQVVEDIEVTLSPDCVGLELNISEKALTLDIAGMKYTKNVNPRQNTMAEIVAFLFKSANVKPIFDLQVVITDKPLPLNIEESLKELFKSDNVDDREETAMLQLMLNVVERKAILFTSHTQYSLDVAEKIYSVNAATEILCKEAKIKPTNLSIFVKDQEMSVEEALELLFITDEPSDTSKKQQLATKRMLIARINRRKRKAGTQELYDNINESRHEYKRLKSIRDELKAEVARLSHKLECQNAILLKAKLKQ